MATAASVRPWLGISPSAWEEAIEAVGPEYAAVVLAAILQRSSLINSAGGYLRNLTEKARAGAFSLGPTLMALIRPNLQKGSQKCERDFVFARVCVTFRARKTLTRRKHGFDSPW